MSLLKRSHFKCPSCECQCHLETQVQNEKGMDSESLLNRHYSEIHTNQGKDAKFRTDFTDPDIKKVKTNMKETSIKNSLQSSQVNTKSTKVCNDIEDNENEEARCKAKKEFSCQNCARKRVDHHHTISGRGKPCMKFVWNKHMLKDMDKILHSDWLLYISHGFIGQCSILVF